MTTSPRSSHQQEPPHEPHPNHDRGLEFDLSTLMSRRSLGMFLGAGTAAVELAACTPGGSSSTTSNPTPSAPSTTTAPAASASASASATPTLTRAIAEFGAEIPQETADPFPGDGSNGPNVLEASGVVRQDISSSFGNSTTKVEGVPLTVTLTLLDGSSRTAANGCEPLIGAAVYAWHCDRDGKYSMYDSGLKNENYLRGVQEADADGQVLAVSQIALTAAACKEVYASARYESSARNFPNTTLKSDNVFGDDGGIYQLATMAGSVSGGYTAGLNVTV